MNACPKTSPELLEAFRKSLVLAALENLLKHDDDATARAVYRARYLDLTDGRLPQ